MSGYPGNNPPQGYPSQYPPMYPQQYPQQNPQQPNQMYPNITPQGAPGPYPGFNPYPNNPNNPNPSAMSYPGYPGVQPSAPMPGQFPNVTPTPPFQGYSQPVEWIPSNSNSADSLAYKAVVAGYEGHDGSPIWVIRSHFEGDLIPGKLAIKHRAAYVPWGGRENRVEQFEVCCAPPDKVRWVQSQGGSTPPNAVQGGRTSSGETLYIGRAKHQGSLTPGKIHPSHKVLYISFGGEEVPHPSYEVLCTV